MIATLDVEKIETHEVIDYTGEALYKGTVEDCVEWERNHCDKQFIYGTFPRIAAQEFRLAVANS